jgi:hypothetical protein
MSQTDAAVLLIDSLADYHKGPVRVSDLKAPIYRISSDEAAFDELREQGSAGVFLLLRKLARDGVLTTTTGAEGGFTLGPKGEGLAEWLRREHPDIPQRAKDAAETD